MADILKPLYGNVWAEEGEKLSPGSTKIAAGWVQEMMPYQYENFLQNRSDVAISYLLQKGIPEYSIEQEYTANKSVVTYNSQLYMATATVTGVVPTTKASWKRLTISLGVNGAVPVSFGGTGATNAADARVNLGIGTSATADFPVANGLVVKLANNTLVARTITGTSGYIAVTNGDGISGNPTINVGENVAKTDTDAAWTTTSSIRLPAGSTAQRGVGAPGRIRFNLESGVYEGYDNTGWNPIGSVGALDVQNFQGDGIRTTFTLSSTPRSENNTQVYFNGVYQQKNTYNLVGNDLVFDEAPTSDINIEVVNVSSVPIGTTTAAQTSIVDSGNYFSSGSVEGALQEVGLKASFVKDAILSYPNYTTASAAAATLPDGQRMVSEYDGVRGVVNAGTIDQEQSIYAAVDYAKIRSYTGRGTRLRVVDPTGAHWWVRKGTDADNGGTILKDGSGRSWWREFSGAVNVIWFGASPGSANDSSSAIQAAIDSLATNNDTVTGGYIFVPAGRYRVGKTISMRGIHPDKLSSLMLVGEGLHNTVLEALPGFVGATIVDIDLQHYCGLQDIHLLGGMGSDVYVAHGLKITGGSHHTLIRVFCQNATSSAFLFKDNFMLTMQGCRAKGGDYGFNFEGFHTSLSVDNCYAVTNRNAGWYIRDVCYSTFKSCASDFGILGYDIGNVSSVAFIGCGAESTQRSAFRLIASSESDATSLMKGVRATFLECFSINTDLEGQGYGSLYSEQLNTSTIDVTIDRFYEHNATNGIGVATNAVSLNHKVELRDCRFVGTTYGVGLVGKPTGVSKRNAVTVAAANTPVFDLQSVFGSASQYSGVLHVWAGNASPQNSELFNGAAYVLLVTKSTSGSGVVQIAANGLIAGESANAPSFTWSLDSANNRLLATPIGSTSGVFHFYVSQLGALSAI